MWRSCRVVLLLPILCGCQLEVAPQTEQTVEIGSTEGGVHHRLHPYLQQKLQELDTVMRQANVINGGYASQTDLLEIRVINSYLDELSHYGGPPSVVLNVWDSLYVLVEDNVLQLHQHQAETPGGHGGVMMEFVRVLPEMDGFISAQSTVMDDQTLILFIFEDHVDLHSSPNNGDWSTLTRIQTITNERLKPIAAEFVHLSSGLYLPVAYSDNFGGGVNSLVYEWLGSHFDETHELPTAGAVDMAVVYRPNHFYVAIAERPPRSSKHGVSIFKITPGMKPLRHRINIAAPRRLLTYEEFHDEDETFLLVLDKSGKATVFKLEGDEFTEHHGFDLGTAPGVVSMAYLEAVPVLLTTHGNIINMSQLSHYTLTPEQPLTVEGVSIATLDLVEVRYGLYSLVAVFSTGKGQNMIQIVNFAVRRKIYVKPPPVDPVAWCVEQLTEELDARQRFIDDLNFELHRIEVSEDEIVEEISLPHEVTLSLSKVGQMIVDTGSTLNVNEEELRQLTQHVQLGLEEMEGIVELLVYKDRPIVVDYPLVLDGDLKVNRLEAEFIQAEKVNGEEFKSNHFVWDKQDISSDINGDHVIDELHVINLTAPTIFLEGFLINPTAKDLQVNNILMPPDETINGIRLDDIVLKGDERVIQGNKIIDIVVADNVAVEHFGELNMETVFSEPPLVKTIITTGDVIVEDLFVEQVNDVNIHKFMEEVFLSDFDDTIEGDVIFNEVLEINELETNFYQGIPVEEIFTKTTNQTITADMDFSSLVFGDGQFGSVNGVNISNIALVGKHNIIKSPVTISSLNIKGNLILNCGKNQPDYCNLVDVSWKDKLQIYEAPVYIDGSLTVGDINFSAETEVVVGDQRFSTDYENIFWMKTKKQVIPNEVTFSAGLTVDHVEANELNGVPLKDILTVNSDYSEITMVFDKLVVNKDLMVQPDSECYAVTELGKDVVTSYGDFVITGNKVFTGTVEVRNLISGTIDGVLLDDIVLRDDPREVTFNGAVNVESVEVLGDMRAYCDINARLVNGYPLRRMAERALYVDQDAYLESATFYQSLEASSLFVDNGPLAEGLRNMDGLFEGINLTVLGELTLTNGVNQVQYLNGIDFESYVGQVVDKAVGGLVAGKKIFDKGLQVSTALEAKTINGIDMESIMKNAVMKHGAHRITGTHTIENLYTDNLITEYINEFKVDNFVDTTAPIVINSSLIFENVNVFGTLNAESPFDLGKYKESTNKIQPRCWNEVVVDGGIGWTIPGPISNIIENAVHGYHDNVITGNVKFSAPVDTNNLVTSVYVDDVDIQFLATDAVLRSDTVQEIFGKKTFIGPSRVNKLQVEERFYCENTGYDLKLINETMARKNVDNCFQGHVTVNGNITANIIKANSITGVPDLKDIVTIESIQPINNVEAFRVHVSGDLGVKNLNGIDFTKFLDSIVLTEGETQYVYGDVEFQRLEIGNLETKLINNVSVDDIVFDEPNANIVIEGDVTFEKGINIEGDIHVDILNKNKLDQITQPVPYLENDVIYENEFREQSNSTSKGNNNNLIKEQVYKAIKQIEARIDSSIAILAEMDNKLAALKEIYENDEPEFLYLDLLKHINISIEKEAISSASCKNYSCSIVVHRNFDCPQSGCSCFLRRSITINTTNWTVSSLEETFHDKSTFEITGSEARGDSTIETIIGDDCRITISFKININNNSIDVTGNIKARIVDVKSVLVNNHNLIAIGVDGREESSIMFVNPQSHMITHHWKAPTCYVRSIAISVIENLPEEDAHVFFASGEKCGFAVSAYSVHNETKEITPIDLEISTAHLLSATTTQAKEKILVLATTDGAKTQLNELIYDSRKGRYFTRQHMELDSVLVGLKLINIHGKRKYATVLCLVSSDGNVAVYNKPPLQGWQKKSSGRVEGATGLTELKGFYWPLIFVTSSNSSAILSLISNGL